MTSGEYWESRNIETHSLWKIKKPLCESLDIELTERCNNNCIHCYINRAEHDTRALNRELTTDEWKGIIRQAADLGVLSIQFTGGEPLLRGDFPELYEYTRRLGIPVTICSNARLVTSDLCDLFVKIPPREKLLISVYGMTENTYEAATGVRGSFKEFWDGANLLRERKIPFSVRFVGLPENNRDQDAFQEWAVTIPGMEKPQIDATILLLRGRRDSKRRNDQISARRMTPEQVLAILTRDGDTYTRERREFFSKFLVKPTDRLFPCGITRKVCIDAYGMVQPCLLLRKPELCYDLTAGSLRDALTNFFPGITGLTGTNPDFLRRCARCFLRGLCDQCPAHSWAEHGTLDTPVEYLCSLIQAEARHLGLLGPGELSWDVPDGHERVERLIGTIHKG